MTDAEIVESIKQLDDEQKKIVMQFVDHLKSPKIKGTCGKDLIRFSGVLSREEAEEMMRVIEEDCERIDWDGW